MQQQKETRSGKIMAKKDYSALGADEVTRLLGDDLEKHMEIMRDKKRGVLSTLFGVLAHVITSHRAALQDAVLEKNGIEKIDGPQCKDGVCHNYLKEIVMAVEARGSDAAAKIKIFDQFTREIEAIVQKTARPKPEGKLARAVACYHLLEDRVMTGKNWEPDVK
jgi:hypothetical protein